MIYTAKVIIFGKTFTAKGDTATEAIANLQPGNAKGRVILCVEKDGKTRERVLPAPVATRLFNSRGMSREVALKNAASLFDL